MAVFRRVEDRRAGPDALGILVPPGARTFVILRPRALDWDLIPLEEGERPTFCAFDRDDAAALARRLHRALEDASTRDVRSAAILLVPDGFLASLRALGMRWVACPRVPGRVYRPCVFPSRDDAMAAIDRLLPYLCPEPGADQEYYFNTQNFSAAETK